MTAKQTKRRNWSSTTLYREVSRYVRESGITAPNSYTVAELLDDIARDIVGEAVGEQLPFDDDQQ